MGKELYIISLIQDGVEFFKADLTLPDLGEVAFVEVPPRLMHKHSLDLKIAIENVDPEIPEAETGDSPIGE